MGIDVPMNSSMNSLSARLSANGARSATDFDFRHATREARRHAIPDDVHHMPRPPPPPPVGAFGRSGCAAHEFITIMIIFFLVLFMHTYLGSRTMRQTVSRKRNWLSALLDPAFRGAAPVDFSRPVQATSSCHFICLRAALPFACVAFQIRWHLMT